VRDTITAVGSKRKGGGEKKEIRSFSKKSRRGYLKVFGKIPENKGPNWWQDFTFADDVMIGLTLSQRAVFATETIDRFRKRFKRRFSGSYVLWKRENQVRKSGPLKGQYCPHIHALIYLDSFPHAGDVARALASAQELAVMWVDCTKTQDREKALAVATHEKSYRRIVSLMSARRYAVAYTGKQDYQLFPESTGRSWGTIGEVPEDPGEEMRFSGNDEIWLRRIARRMVKKRNKKFKRSLSRLGTSTFFMMSRASLNRLLYWIRQGSDVDNDSKGSDLDKEEVMKNVDGKNGNQNR
jgi:hypothetical protein